MSDESRRRVEWGHLALLAVIVTVVLSYLFDARGVSLNTNNLLLVQPAAVIAVVLALLVLPQVVVRRARDEDTAKRWEERFKVLRVGALAAVFGVFVVFMERVGFDVATFAFTAIGLVICGERRIWLVIPFSAIFTVAVIYGYQLLVPYPFPLLVL